MGNLVLLKNGEAPSEDIPHIGMCAVGDETLVVQTVNGHLHITLYYNPGRIALWTARAAVVEGSVINTRFDYDGTLNLASLLLDAFHREYTGQSKALSFAFSQGKAHTTVADHAASIVMNARALQDVFYHRFGVDADAEDAEEILRDKFLDALGGDDDDSAFDRFINGSDLLDE